MTIKASKILGGNNFSNKLLAIILFLAFITFVNTLGNKFALDDFMVVKENTLVKQGISALPQIFSNPYHTGHNTLSNDFYRPLSIALFAIEYNIWGFNTTAYHFINLLLYLLTLMVIFKASDAIFNNKQIIAVFIACLLFAIHPIHTEVVANIKSCDELLCLLFSFSALYCYIWYARQGKITIIILATVCFLLAALAKETAVTFTILIPFSFLFYINEHKTRSYLICISVILTTICYLFVRNQILGQYNANHGSDVSHLANPLALPGIEAATRWASTFYILGYYLRLFIYPYPLVCDYSFNSIPLTNFSNPVVWLSLCFYIGISILAIYRFIKFKKDAIAFAIIFFLVCLSLFSNIPFLMSGIMAERFIFFASYGFTLFAGLIISHLLGTPQQISLQTLRKPIIVVISIYVLAFMFISIKRNTEWKDSLTLFSTDLPKFPQNSRLLCFLGSVKSIDEANAEVDQATKLKIQKDAVDLLRKSLAISPDYFECHTELGQTYFKMGLLDSAEREDQIALQLKPDDVLSLNELAGIAFKRKDFKTSLSYCRRVLQLDNNYVTTLSNISLCLAIDEKFDSAIYMLRKAMLLDPEYNANNINMAIVYKIMNQFDSSKYYEKRAQIANPSFHLNYSK